MQLNGVDRVGSKERTEITIAFTRDRNKGKRLALIASGSHAFVAAAWISLRSYGIYDEFFQSSMDPQGLKTHAAAFDLTIGVGKERPGGGNTITRGELRGFTWPNHETKREDGRCICPTQLRQATLPFDPIGQIVTKANGEVFGRSIPSASPCLWHDGMMALWHYGIMAETAWRFK